MSIKVLYIAGAGRSGTTFLSLVLSQHTDMQNVGQIRDLPQGVAQTAPCSCGATVPDCNFWHLVRTGFEARFGTDGMSDLANRATAFRKAANRAGDWQDPEVRQNLIQAHAAYLEQLEVLYTLSAEHSAGRMLVDSSKSVDIALALGLIPGLELHILNLVRDPRAVAVSWSKVIKNTEKLRRRTRNWMVRQQRLEQLEGGDQAGFMRLRYEDLTEDPKGWVQKIQAWAGLPEQLNLFTSTTSANISWERAHLFPPANATVLKERRATITIVAADSWRQAKNTQLHHMAETETFPYAEKLGYRKGAASR